MSLINWSPQQIDRVIQDLTQNYQTMNSNTDQLQSEIQQLAQQSQGQWSADWNSAYKVIDDQQNKMQQAFNGAIQALDEMKSRLQHQDNNNQIQ